MLPCRYKSSRNPRPRVRGDPRAPPVATARRVEIRARARGATYPSRVKNATATVSIPELRHPHLYDALTPPDILVQPDAGIDEARSNR